jgi:hypothetical protein
MRKGVKTMTYSKPEITSLGDAARLIQGSRQNSGEISDGLQQVGDCELDD